MSQEDKIIKYIINQCPVGELGQLNHDLKIVYPQFQIENYQNEIKQFYEDHYTILQNEEQNFLIAKELHSQEGYYDPRNSKKIQIDFFEQCIQGQVSVTVEQIEILNLQNKIQNQLDEYKIEYLNRQNSIVTCLVQGDIEQPQIFICLSSKFYNFKNLCGGEWNSVWNLNKWEFEGKIIINSHYFEEGNIQLKKEQTYSYQIDQSQDLVNQIMKYIQKSESELLEQLDQFYNKQRILKSLSQNVFKVIRRVLPVTNQKMDWNMQAHKLLANLKQQ